ncbi:MAG: DUF4339 domain-containing protein [Elusimicrobia bacterium]|nr:DUF4339 domain-containing protein [Elusimicrobiota bacterium]
MKYWVYVNNEVKGPFDRAGLEAQPGFGPQSLVCPENASGADGWKPVSTFSDLNGPVAAPAPAPVPARPIAVESPMAMTMRGTLISDPVVDGKVLESPLPAPAPDAKPPLPAAGPRPATPSAEPGGEMGKILASLSAIADAQAQLVTRMAAVEKAMTDMRTLLFPSAPGK